MGVNIYFLPSYFSCFSSKYFKGFGYGIGSFHLVPVAQNYLKFLEQKDLTKIHLTCKIIKIKKKFAQSV